MKTSRQNDRISILIARGEQKREEDKSSEDEAVAVQWRLQDPPSPHDVPLTCCCSSQQRLLIIPPDGFWKPSLLSAETSLTPLCSVVVTGVSPSLPGGGRATGADPQVLSARQAWGQATTQALSRDSKDQGHFPRVVLLERMAQDVNCAFLIGMSSASRAHQRTLLTAVKFISSRQRDNNCSLRERRETSL